MDVEGHKPPEGEEEEDEGREPEDDDKELCLREALAVGTPPAPEPSAKRPGS